MYVDQLEKGSYLKSDDTIFLQPENGSNWKFTLTFVAGLSHFKFPSGQLVSLQKLQNQHIDHYPFTYELNRWRESSPHPLSEGELIEKFQNYAAFMSAYMRWAQKTDQNLSLKYISGPLQYANNGLMMRKLEDTGSWCDFFYSGDCEKMDVILRNYFDGLIIDWQYTHDRILMLSDALLQIKKDMENYKPRFESSR